MKKIILFFVAMMALGVMSCDRLSKKGGTDLVILNGGKLSFYNVKSKALTPFEAETDSVINMVFDKKNHLYYTVSKNNNLTLKMVDFNESTPAAKPCADWQMTLDDAMDYMFGTGASSIFLDASGENVYINKNEPDEPSLMGTMAYNIATGKIRMLDIDEYLNIYFYSNPLDASHFYTEEGKFYYVAPEGKFCLNDKIDFSEVFEDEEERNDMDFTPQNISPDGEKTVYAAAVFWGEGWGYYCVSTCDGSVQNILKDSDIWDSSPAWLPDGSLVYVGKEPLPKDDPEYDEEWVVTRPCIKIIAPDGKATAVISTGADFAVRPQGEPMPTQDGLADCDLAIFDNGKLVFYNSADNVFTPIEVEKDSVINGVFVDDDIFYYTVSIGDELYLKRLYLRDRLQPCMITDWDLELNDCVSETYGRASELNWIPSFDRISINHNFSWDFYNFADIKFYDYINNMKLNGWCEDDDMETDIYDEDFLQFEQDMEHFTTIDDNFYYVIDTQMVCLTDKLNFMEYASDTDYYENPEFNFYSIDPTRKNVLYSSIIEWGDLGHGPMCFSSLDGTIQMAFKGTDAPDCTTGWLKNGSLLFEDENGINMVTPDGKVSLLSNAHSFTVK